MDNPFPAPTPQTSSAVCNTLIQQRFDSVARPTTPI